MATEPTIAVLNVEPTARRNGAVLVYPTLSDYWALTKPEVNFLILVTTFAGFYLASCTRPRRIPDLARHPHAAGHIACRCRYRHAEPVP